jgi:predicted permease
MRKLLRRLRYLLQRDQRDAELADELAFHREMAQADGKPIGNELLFREEAREAWGWMWIDRLQQDLRYAWRVLAKSPGFTLGAILMLAIGIGVNVAAFSFFNLVMLRPLPVPDPESLLRFDRRAPNQYWSDVPYPAMAFYREHTRTLSAVIALNATRLTLEDGPAKPLRTQFVTRNYFKELGATAALGRLDAGEELAVVLGYPFWKSHYASDPGILNKQIRINGKLATVIGVASATFSGLSLNQPDVWVPIEQKPMFVVGSKLLTDFTGTDGGVNMWGRLRPGLSANAAEDELRLLAAELRKQQPNAIWENETLVAAPGGYAQNSGGVNRGNSPPPTLSGRLMPIFLLMAALMLLILGVACANLGSLLLARGVARQREISIRASVGASRGRLVRQLLTESLLLGLLGAAAGFGLGYAVLRIMMAWTDAPGWLDPTPDLRVVAFALGIALFASLIFGLAPALQATRINTAAAYGFRNFLVAAQVAASCVLLIVAGLLLRGLNHVLTATPGFEYEQVVLIEPRLSTHGYSDSAARAYLEALGARLRGVAGVESVSVTATPPLGNRHAEVGIDREGQPGLGVSSHRIDPEFFDTMRIRMLAGRGFLPGDSQSAIVSEPVARSLWPNLNPLGQKLRLGDDSFNVVGVVASARLVEPANSDAMELYRPIGASEMPSAGVIVRISGPPESFAPYVLNIAKSIDPTFVPEVETLKGSFRRKLESTERTAAAVSLMGGIALLLACLGIGGTIAYAVSQRTKEIGIRMALGAEPRNVASAMVRKFVLPVGAGLLAGTGIAALLSQYLRNQLFGLSNLDPITYVGAVVLFLAAAALAAMFPLRKALRVDPLLALRAD